jgi:hypothetical protein
MKVEIERFKHSKIELQLNKQHPMPGTNQPRMIRNLQYQPQQALNSWLILMDTLIGLTMESQLVAVIKKLSKMCVLKDH